MDPPTGGGPAPKGAPLPPAPVTKLAVRLKSDEPFNPDIARAMVALDRNSARLTEAYLESLKRVEKAQVEVALASMRQDPPPPRIDEATISDAEVFAPFAATAMPAVTVPTLKEVTVNTLPKSWKASRLIGGSAAPDAATIKLVAENFASQLTEELRKLSIDTALKIEIDALKKRATEVRALQKDFDEEIKKRREQLDKTMTNFVQALSRLANITGGSAASAILENLPENIKKVWGGIAPGQPLDSALTQITQILLAAAQALETDLTRVRTAVGEVRSLEDAATINRELNAKLGAAENARIAEFNLRVNAERQAAELLESNKRGTAVLKKAEEENASLRKAVTDTTATADDLRSRLKACEDVQAFKDAENAKLKEEIDQVKKELLSIRARTKTEDADAAKKTAEESARRFQDLEDRRARETQQLTAQLNESLLQERARALEQLSIAITAGNSAILIDRINNLRSRPYGKELLEIDQSLGDVFRLQLSPTDYARVVQPIIGEIREAILNPATPYRYAQNPRLQSLRRRGFLARALALIQNPTPESTTNLQVLANEAGEDAPYHSEIMSIRKTVQLIQTTEDEPAKNSTLTSLIEDVRNAILSDTPLRLKVQSGTSDEDLRSDTTTSGKTGAKRSGVAGGKAVDTKNSISAGKEESISDAEDTPSTDSIREREKDEKK